MIPLFHLCHNIFGWTDGQTRSNLNAPRLLKWGFKKAGMIEA